MSGDEFDDMCIAGHPLGQKMSWLHLDSVLHFANPSYWLDSEDLDVQNCRGVGQGLWLRSYRES